MQRPLSFAKWLVLGFEVTALPGKYKGIGMFDFQFSITKYQELDINGSDKDEQQKVRSR